MARNRRTRKDPGLLAALKASKSMRSLALAIGIKPQSLIKWEYVPPERVIAVEEVTGVPREVLRPDLYPPRTRQTAAV
jgi:DNA-binding transcriptional regulator YdaS (Cro superfamily)